MLVSLLALAHAATIEQSWPPPDGYARVPAGPFAAWVQALEVRDGPIYTHDGRVVGHRGQPVVLPLVPGDLQQCADSAIRLRAEWLRANGHPVVFHATSGDPIPWARFQAGERPYVAGSGLAWTAGGTRTWDGYLTAVFTWAGTRSLHLDTVPTTTPEPGDLVVAPGSPGHAIVLLDVATGPGGTVVLVGEGYMPAQDLHVEEGPIDGWWPWRDGVTLAHWAMPASGLRRFPAP